MGERRAEVVEDKVAEVEMEREMDPVVDDDRETVLESVSSVEIVWEILRVLDDPKVAENPKDCVFVIPEKVVSRVPLIEFDIVVVIDRESLHVSLMLSE